MKAEDRVYQTGLLDISIIGAYLSLPLAGMVPYLVVATKRVYDDDRRKYSLKKSVAEITIVGNYNNPMAPYPSYNSVYHAEQELKEERFRDEELADWRFQGMSTFIFIFEPTSCFF